LKTRITTVLLTLLLITLAASAQTDVAPPPRPPSQAPSLAATMNLIHDQLASQTKISYVETSQNTLDFTLHTENYTYEIGLITADAEHCVLSYQTNHVPISTIPLREVQKLALVTYERSMTDSIINSARVFGSQNRVVVNTDPPLINLQINWQNMAATITLRDLHLADQLANEISHAVDLCGGAKDAYKNKAIIPAPNSTENGPSFDATMSFIQDKLNDIGRVTFKKLHQTGPDGSTYDEGMTTEEISNVFANQDQCYISYHHRLSVGGQNLPESNQGFSLRDVQNINLEPYEQYIRDIGGRIGAPGDYVGTNPPVTAMLINRPHGVWNIFPFTDPTLADRVAKALTHAVELCSNGNKEPF
jgi:hypothetical protein